MQGSLIGVGPALRKARERRRVSIDEASRGTKLRTDVLHALEDERFDQLLGEVYVRGALRTYAGYLGLDPRKVLDAYAASAGVRPPAPPEPPTQIRTAIGAARRRDNHRLAVLVVMVVLLFAAGFGLLSSRSSSPPAAALPASASPASTDAHGVVVSVRATRRVQATPTIDGVPRPATTLQPGESRTFEGEEFLTLRLSRGDASVTVNGTDLGTVGRADRPWQGTFSPTSIASPTPPHGRSPGATSPEGGSASPSA